MGAAAEILPPPLDALGLASDAVRTDAESRALFGQDVSGAAAQPLAVIRPTSVADIVRVVEFARDHGLSILPRGGGMSYSGGYVCDREGALCLDMGAMNRVLDINTEDMHVTVEAGCTWQALHEALAPLGVRTPYWGTLSGLMATVGGSVSQNSLFWGSGQHGSAADSVLGLQVVLASGEVLYTGASAAPDRPPFFRHYGPDLTGLFTSDAGALGVKAAVTLRLIPAATGQAWLSFQFERHGPLIEAMSAVARQGLADACFGFDPAMQAQRMKRESLAADISALKHVVGAQQSLLKGVREGARMAVAGRRFVDTAAFAVHFMVEERTEAAANDAAERIRALCAEAGGSEVENTVPKVARAHPFGPLNSMVGPAGERWLPVHGLLPHSKAQAAYEAVEALFEREARTLARHGIVHGTLLTYAGTNCFVVEPVFYWRDALNALHRHAVEEDVLRRVPSYPADQAARGEVMRLRQAIIDVFREFGAAHLQVGRLYPYRASLGDSAAALVTGLKKLLDPDDRMNPGVLGL